MIGKTISHYKILEKLGEGGMGVVYKAQDTKLDRLVALKFLPKHLLCDNEAKARFEHEAKAASALDHPNICNIHEIDEVEGECFISMAYVEGKSIKELLKEKTFSIEEILNVAIQVAEGLNAAHKKGIVHRDIKSDNIMLTADGLVKIMDFGLAKLRGVSRVTKEGTTLGTLSYMSPEQVHGIEVDQRSDIFSFGVVLYDLVTGQLPFRGEHEAAIVYSILNEMPEPLARYKSGVPEVLQRIVSKALEKNREMRYQHVDDLSADLRKLRTEVEAGLTKTLETSKKLMPSIAVLPFRDLSSQKDQEYFCDGIAEELTNALVNVEGLTVAAVTSSFQFKGKNQDVRKIGEQLDVSTVLEGSVRKAGNRVRITCQLINVADGYHLWSQTFDREMEDIFKIQDEISQAVVDALKIKLVASQKESLVRRYPENLEAYNLYLKGRYFWNKRYEVGLQKGMEYFQQAIEKDPTYALAYAGIADSYNVLGYYNFLPPKEACPKGKKAAIKALEIDSELAEAHTSVGWVKTFYDWDWKGAEREFKHSLELNPNYATTHHYYALYLLAMRRFDEAFKEIQKAQELDPLAIMINTTVGIVLYFMRRHEEALEQYLKTIDMDPNFPLTHAYIVGPYVEKSQFEEAIDECEKAYALSGGSTYAKSFLGYVYAISGNNKRGKEVIDELIELSKRKYVSPTEIASIYIWLDEKDKAFEWLQKGFDEKDNWLVWLNVHPIYDKLRSDPRFTSLLKKVGLEK
jgi:serine/threonine-protein kinase